MNSTESYKGFISFAILSGIVLTALIGFRILNRSTNTQSRASSTKVAVYDIKITDVTDTSATVTWKTQNPSTTSLVYSSADKICKSPDVSCKSFEEDSPKQSHIVTLSNLESSTIYYALIKLDDLTYYPKTDPIIIKTNESVSDIPESNQKKPKPKEEFISPVVNNDYSGFQEVLGSSSEKDSSGILGVQTNLVEIEITKQFKEALETNNPRYDFNKDGTVTNSDYPLFMEFILSRGD